MLQGTLLSTFQSVKLIVGQIIGQISFDIFHLSFGGRLDRRQGILDFVLY